jgi:hypothetical protein
MRKVNSRSGRAASHNNNIIINSTTTCTKPTHGSDQLLNQPHYPHTIPSPGRTATTTISSNVLNAQDQQLFGRAALHNNNIIINNMYKTNAWFRSIIEPATLPTYRP